MGRPRKDQTNENESRNPEAINPAAAAAEPGPQNTEEARAQSEETLRRQETMTPEPSQEEADAIREGRVTTNNSPAQRQSDNASAERRQVSSDDSGAGAYQNRQAKSE